MTSSHIHSITFKDTGLFWSPLLSIRATSMGVEPPFLYDPPSRYSFTGSTDKGFNPKAVTQASWSPPPTRAAPRPQGPLINSVNKHPDSYLIVPYGNINAKPMSPRTKYKVKYSRWAQLFLRACALLGALGMLVCVICIKGTQDTVGWIIRVPVSSGPSTVPGDKLLMNGWPAWGGSITYCLRNLPPCQAVQSSYPCIISKLYVVCCNRRRRLDPVLRFRSSDV